MFHVLRAWKHFSGTSSLTQNCPLFLWLPLGLTYDCPKFKYLSIILSSAYMYFQILTFITSNSQALLL